LKLPALLTSTSTRPNRRPNRSTAAAGPRPPLRRRESVTFSLTAKGRHAPGSQRLDLVGVNVSPAIGPAIGGLVIARLGGVPAVVALNALSVLFLAVALLRPAEARRRERFVRAFASR
jgi:hypothetical protein